jgi:hypothetical protein
MDTRLSFAVPRTTLSWRPKLLLLMLRTVIITAKCRREEVAALWSLYELTGGANWRQNKNWHPDGDPCDNNARWVGVGVTDRCNRWRDGEDCYMGRITALYLESNNLNGSLSQWTQLREMRNLTVLELSYNSLYGTMPTQIGRLSNIGRLAMSMNQLEGTLPTELGQINRPGLARELTQIVLARNNFSGTVPTEIAVHTRLTMLDLQSNSLSGTMPTELARLAEVSVLYLQDNPPLSGTLPEPLTPMHELYFLDVSRSRLSGTLPPTLGDLQALQSLRLEGGALSGTIPSELTGIYMLRQIMLADNRLTGNLPAQIGKLQNLRYLDVYNNSMTGDVPPSIRDLINLEHLFLANDHLLPLRRKYCGQRLPDFGKYSWVMVREEYDEMMSTPCPEGQMHDTSFTFSTLQDSGVYEM